MTLPDFLFIGPDKTGSSWLHYVLSQHPDVFVPDCKDIYFFDRYYDRGMQWYASFFEDAPAGVGAVGELSHDYLFSPDVARRIREELPGVQLLTCLRDPVERTFSQYLYMVRSGRTRVSFADAIDQFPILINNSLYWEHLRHYYDLFDRSRIAALRFERLESQPSAFAADVFGFLGVDPSVSITFERRVRPASTPRSYRLARVMKRGAEIARNLGFAKLVGRIKHNALTEAFYRPYGEGERPQLDPDTEARLRDAFADDIIKLERLTGEDLASWLGPAPPEASAAGG